MQKNLMIKDYIKKLSSKDPAPGGGSAAALVGVVSSALTAMVFNLTVGKKVYEEYNEEEKNLISNSLLEVEKYNNELMEVMDKDGEAFLGLMAAFRMPKNTDSEKAERAKSINMGYKNALEVPLNLAKQLLKLYDNILISSQYGNKNVICDAGVAAILLSSAIESAILNVNVNLKGIKDENYKNEVNKECINIMKQALLKKEKIMNIVNFKI
ncbi:cyclodeaminase/cyclohydrolase family protein [Clostridium aestuarii]|uniref:Cyclodeaminase/cyclohydrolase family protein n=1 Tax=Clostridium aestuarii TaxID=338193 RepID=A0ABT4CX57_9CLOT|nr:cyclodeaminase/cyclohydrolase family protein [Clostridium aestuarii]MCY6483583.1 cyclodeaminase/cyclohydrolase family protein [Clostridium aestuarii]